MSSKVGNVYWANKNKEYRWMPWNAALQMNNIIMVLKFTYWSIKSCVVAKAIDQRNSVCKHRHTNPSKFWNFQGSNRNGKWKILRQFKSFKIYEDWNGKPHNHCKSWFFPYISFYKFSVAFAIATFEINCQKIYRLPVVKSFFHKDIFYWKLIFARVDFSHTYPSINFQWPLQLLRLR